MTVPKFGGVPVPGGVGLGLTIARDVARSHGGDVRLERPPQGGLRARVHLPR
jgi:two-component system osmolarity sensor histidine kinase EnvZ